MSSDELDQKYKNVVNKLTVINNKINNLDNSILNLNKLVTENLKINDKGYQRDNLQNIHNNLVSISSVIRNNIIPSMNRKINN